MCKIKKSFIESMKKFILFGALAAILALVSFEMVWATHNTLSITPKSAPAGTQNLIVTIKGNNFPALYSPFVTFQIPETTDIKVIPIPASLSDADSSSFQATVNIADKSSLEGVKTVTVGLGDFCPPSVDCATTNFTVGKAGGGVGPGPGPGPGSGFVEPVPDRYGGIPEGPQTGDDFVSTIEGITNWLFVLLLVFAVIFIVLAGFQFIVGGGEPQAVAQARNKLIWAVVGVAVALLARGIPAAISNLMGS